LDAGRLESWTDGPIPRIELEDARALAQWDRRVKGDERKARLSRGGEKRPAERIERRVSLKRDLLAHLLKVGVDVVRAPTLTPQLLPGVHVLVWSPEGNTRVMRAATTDPAVPPPTTM